MHASESIFQVGVLCATNLNYRLYLENVQKIRSAPYNRHSCKCSLFRVLLRFEQFRTGRRYVRNVFIQHPGIFIRHYTRI